MKQKILSSKRKFPNIYYLPIDRPARLRPDAVSRSLASSLAYLTPCFLQHATGDCLHIMTGAGILEGWTHYIWQFISRESPRS
jgi:hypothetical protein